jgi:hypothetical protein
MFATNKFIVNNFSFYNGQGKYVENLGDYIKNNLANKRMTGDTDGLEPYVNNPLSFSVESKEFKELRNDTLTEQLYSKVDNSKVDLLIKFKDHVGDFEKEDIYKDKFNFNHRIVIGVYEIFYK